MAVPLGDLRAKQLSAIAMLAQKFGEDSLQLTKEQNIEFQNVSTRQAPKIIKSMRRMGLSFVSEKGIPAVVACPGTEFCVLAVTDSQGAAHSLLNNFRAESVENEEILKGVTIAVSGCPNSCAKHQVADIGLSGAMTTVGKDRRYAYTLLLGGSQSEGFVRLGETALKGLTEEVVVPVVQTLLECVSRLRENGESFREAVQRIGPKAVGKSVEERLQSQRPKVWEKVLMECQENLEEEMTV